MVSLREDERLDYLLAEDMKIIQSKTVFAFSLDAVLLAKFAYVPIQKGRLLIFVREMASFHCCFRRDLKPLLQGLKFKNAYMIWQRKCGA